jgi:hypothetical protein
MAIIKRKTKKKIGKQLRKLVKKHGSEVALGAATALVTAVIAKSTGDADKKGKGKSGPKAKGGDGKDGKGGKRAKGKKAESGG